MKLFISTAKDIEHPDRVMEGEEYRTREGILYRSEFRGKYYFFIPQIGEGETLDKYFTED